MDLVIPQHLRDRLLNSVAWKDRLKPSPDKEKDLSYESDYSGEAGFRPHRPLLQVEGLIISVAQNGRSVEDMTE